VKRQVNFLPRGGGASHFGFAMLLAAALFASAPFAATLAARALAGRSDSLGASVASIFVCFASGLSLPDTTTGQPGPAKDRGVDCVLCQTLCHGAAPLAARPGLVVAAPIQSHPLLWMVADRAAPTPRPRLSHRARAPPPAVST
jgi:hypothetical protein